MLLAVVVSAQVDRSSLGGTVTDAAGARVPGATVTAIEIATGLERKAQTSSQGTYIIDGLPVGRYAVTIGKAGFSPVRFESVEQSVGEKRVLNAQLQVEGVGEKATVSEPVVHLDTAGAVVGAPIEQAQLRELPLNGRNFTDLVALVPGVASGSQIGNGGANLLYGVENNFSVSGARSD